MVKCGKGRGVIVTFSFHRSSKTLLRNNAGLSSVQTHPSHQGRGAASMLMKWGVERADADGLPCYVNAEEAAYALYRRFGFVDLYEGGIDLGKFGGDGVYRTMGMVRWPKGKRHEGEH